MTTNMIRVATSEDVTALSDLLVELYAYELPGMLQGPHHAQAELTRRLLVSAPLGVRYVVETDGDVVAVGGLATTEEPRPDTPASAILGAPLYMGPVAGLRTLWGATRGVLTISGPPAPDEALIHSVVVAATHRGRGLGGQLMAHLEEEARRRGKTSATLQVVHTNTGARDFYRRLGYAEYRRHVGPVARWLAYPSVMMRKALTPPDGRPAPG